MTLPTFLGIGVPKAGTTWLHNLLDTHPDAYVPQKAKEVRFFNRYYDLGLDWYEGFFPPDREADQYQAVGEITPHYLYCEECPQRMAVLPVRPKLILMLRNPIDRAWSNYLFRVRLDNYGGSFERFLDESPNVIQWGFYCQHIQRYQAHFEPDELLILLFDQVFNDTTKARKTIADFLDLAPGAFPETAGMNVSNRSYLPRFRSFYALTTRAQKAVRGRHQYWITDLAKKIGVQRIRGVEGGEPSPMRDETRQRLNALYAQEISDLETLLQTDLSQWRS